MTRLPRVAVIPTRDRPEKYAAAYAAILPQVDVVVTVAHDPGGDLEGSLYAQSPSIAYFEDTMNISEAWDLGMSAAAMYVSGYGGIQRSRLMSTVPTHWIAILNDDAVVAPDWFDQLVQAAESNGHVLASGLRGTRGAARERLAGYAFIVKSGTIRPNPRWSWWVSDDHFEHEAKERFGGYTLLESAKVRHSHVDQPASSPLMQQSVADLKAWRAGER